MTPSSRQGDARRTPAARRPPAVTLPEEVSIAFDRVAPRVASPVFVGRAAEVAALRAALDRARSGTAATVVVAGEAGVGKTRLAAELQDQARGLDVLTLAGGCLDVGDGVVAVAPIVEALRPLATLLEPEELERVLGTARAELARLVPELAAADQPVGDLPPGRLFELLLGALHRLAERRPVLLVIEDVHWADRSTRDLLGFLIRNLRGGVALVLTYRSDELHRRHPLRPFLAELERSGRAERLDVGRLDRRELVELLAGILGEAPAPSLVRDIWARSEGNPFFAEELVAARAEGVELPDALRDLLLARVETLSQDSQRVLHVAAVVGRRVDHELLAEVAEQPPAGLTEALREAVTHHILAPDGDGGYEFRHALVREAVYDDLLPMERVPLHAACARALVARAEQQGQPPPAGEGTLDATTCGLAGILGQLAHHWYAAQDLGEALVASVRAGQAAEAAYAPGEAERHYQRALGLWDQAPEAAARCGLDHTTLLQRAAHVTFLMWDPRGAIRLITQALAEVETAAEPLLAGALLERLAGYHWQRGDLASGLTAAERAVATVPAEPPSPERARTLAAHGQMLMLQSHMAAARARCEEAVAVARRTGARAEEGHALNTLGTALGGLGHVEEGLARLEQAYRIARELGDPYDLCRAPFNISAVLLMAGRYEEAVAMSRECADLATRLGLVRGFTAMLYNAVEALTWLGRWDEAERVFDEAVDIDVDLADAGPGSILFVIHARLALWRGDLAAARAELVTAMDARRDANDPQFTSPALATLAEMATWEGRPEEARAAVAGGLALIDDIDEAGPVLALCLAGLEAEAAMAERAAAHDSAARDTAAGVAADLLRRARGAVTADGVVPTGLGQVQLMTAEAHASRVTGGSDPERWGEVATAWEALGAPWPAAHAHWRQAEALLVAGAPRTRAEPSLRRAWTTASALGARRLLAEVEALARRARVDLAPEPSPADGTAGQDAPDTALDRLGLTRREREVLALVADGCSNRQIAETLFISAKTASVHVSNILGKLGVANRAAAAVVAHRVGLTPPVETTPPRR